MYAIRSYYEVEIDGLSKVRTAEPVVFPTWSESIDSFDALLEHYSETKPQGSPALEEYDALAIAIAGAVSGKRATLPNIPWDIDLGVRITSYNVCYTKLLRLLENLLLGGDECLAAAPRDRVVFLGRRIEDLAAAPDEALLDRLVDDRHRHRAFQLRITSYNVCYTKLLRMQNHCTRPARQRPRPRCGCPDGPATRPPYSEKCSRG